MSLLSPSSIAIIGASAEATKVGHHVLHNLITQGFTGPIYPINPKGDDILGKTAYMSLTDVPGPVDLAVIVTPAKTVNSIAEECGKKGVKTLVVISAGFGEIGTPEAHQRENELVAIVRKYNMNLVGPNCLGVIRPSIGMNVSFGENLETPGSVALLSQSGAIAVALMDGAAPLGLKFSLVVSMGNKAAMDECDFLAMCKDDPETKVIGMYLESISNGKRFLQIAADVGRKKPIVLIKSGVSEHGRAAVSSHTGALAGSNAAIDAACKHAGIRRAKTTEEFIDTLRALSMQPLLLSHQIAVITNAGGPGILATDAAEKAGLSLAPLTEREAAELKAALPAAASIQNPIDVLGDAAVDRYAAAVKACVEDKNIDGIAVVLTPQVMTPEEEIADVLIATMKSRPMMPIVTSFMGDKNVAKAVQKLHDHGIPNYPTPERAIQALSTLRANLSHLPGGEGKGEGATTHYSTQPATTLLRGKHGLLDEETTRQLFTAYDLPLPQSSVAQSADEAAAMADEMGYPVVAKISSPQILHKTDIGCVRMNLTSGAAVRAAYAEIMTNAKTHQPDATINGVLIQQFLPAGDEFIVGAIKDSSFGHLIMTGLGGIYTELFRDTSFRIAPVTEKEAYSMLQDLISWKLLLGLRGKKQSDIAALAAIISQVSHLVNDYPQIAELDLNPVLVWHDKVVIADAKVVLG